MPKEPGSYSSADFRAALSELFDNSPVNPGLWVPSQSLGQISIAKLGIYSLATSNPTETVADWTLPYAQSRADLEVSLSHYVEDSMYNIHRVGVRIADILSSQPILAEPVVDEDEMAKITEELATDGIKGVDDLIIMSGLLTKRHLAVVLDSLPKTRYITPEFKHSVKMSARSVDNQLIDDAYREGPESQAVGKFRECLSMALAGDEVVEYSADIFAPKIYLKKEAEDRVAMVRRVDIGNFAAWLKAYEAKEVWQRLGFTHVPIEPILDFDHKQGNVDVRTIALRSQGFSVVRGNSEPDIQDDLDKQRQAVKKGLDQIGILHRHLHSDNLQVVENSGGTPRLYAIDFDQAYIKKDIPRP